MSFLDTPSEYVIESILIQKTKKNDKGFFESFDIVNLFDSIIINEGINYNFIYGSVKVTDTNGIIESLPIMGEESINFKIRKKTGTDFFEIKGLVYSITDRKKVKNYNKVEEYKINFISELAMLNQVQRVSKTYEGHVSDMVKKISSEYLNLEKIDNIENEIFKPYENIFIEKTMDENKINIPNLNPVESINFLTKFSYSQNQNDTNPFNTMFFFYQTRQGFFFQSIENCILNFRKLLKEKKLVKYEYNMMKNTLIKNQPNKRFDINDFFTVSNFEILNFYDNFESVNTGYYGGTNIGYDTLTKSFHKYEFNYQDNFEKLVNLEKYDTNSKDFIFNKNSEKTNILTLPTKAGSDKSDYISQKTSKDIFYDKREKINLLKYVKRSRFNNGMVIQVSIPSNPDIYVNDLINLKFPSFIRVEDREKQTSGDRYLSGDYIVIEIKHIVSNPQTKKWTMILTLLKDSYKKEVE